MKIAITYENENVFQHFGHTQAFKLYDVVDGKVVSTKIITPTEGGHGALSGFLKENGVDTLICGGIGAGAKTALAEVGIALYPGVVGKCDDAINAFLNKTLDYNPDTHCEHHNHDENHSCHNGFDCGEDKHGCKGN